MDFSYLTKVQKLVLLKNIADMLVSTESSLIGTCAAHQETVLAVEISQDIYENETTGRLLGLIEDLVYELKHHR
jgi:hypothetical protein